MNVLFVTSFFTPQTGGVGTFLEDARRFLGSVGDEVYILRPGEARNIESCTLERRAERDARLPPLLGVGARSASRALSSGGATWVGGAGANLGRYRERQDA